MNKIFYSILKKSKNNFGNNIVKIPQKTKKIQIKINGENNRIIFPDDFPPNPKITIQIYGNNNVVELGKIIGQHIRITIGYAHRQTNNTSFKCGDGRINSAEFLLLEDNTFINIGNDFMFSYNINFRCTDDHTIFDFDGNIINRAKSIVVGNHVWIGLNATILKNTKIPDGSVVGCYSVVTKSFDTPNIVIAGNPAKMVKERIKWDERYINEVEHENI